MKAILVISGTNPPQSSALKIAKVVEGLYWSAQIPAEVLSLCDLPAAMFEPAAYEHKPAEFAQIQQRVLHAAALHVITPEYNGSFPGVLKYFIDMLRFPESFDRKPVALVGESDGTWGALRAGEQLQLVLRYRNAHIYPERVFITEVSSRLDERGNLQGELKERLLRQMTGFARFINCLGA